MSEEEFRQPITDAYAKGLSELSPEEIYDGYNPGHQVRCDKGPQVFLIGPLF